MEEKATWLSKLPKVCDLCHRELIGTFVDAKTIHGPWVVLCSSCFIDYGVGLGTDKGQLYNTRGVKLKG